MTSAQQSVLDFFTRQGLMTEPGEYHLLFDTLPDSSKEFHLFDGDELAYFDRMAGLAEGGDADFDARRALFESNPLLRVPSAYRP